MLDEFDEIRIRDLILFDRISALGSITQAARELGIPKPTASRWLAALEERVGVLMHRTTRHLSLTDRGHAFAVHVQQVLAVVRAARIAGRADEVGGTVRVSVPVPLGRIVGGSVIAAFRRDLPGVRLELRLSDERSDVDLVRDRLDLVIRGGVLPDSSCLSRRLARVPMWLYASERYRDEALGSIPVIATVSDEPMLAKRCPEVGRACVIVDDRTAVVEALRAGAGLGVLPAFLGEPACAVGSVFRIDSEPLHVRPVHALYLPSQRDDLRVKILLDHIVASLRRMLGSAGHEVAER